MGHIKKYFILSILYSLPFESLFAACDQTLSAGVDLASIIASAPAGSTICLNKGDYGRIILSGISKSSAVTLQSTSGVVATIGITLSSSNQLTFKNLTFTKLSWSGNANTNIKVLNNKFIGQMDVFGNGDGSPQHNVIDGNTFDDITACSTCYEGRLQIYGGNDLIVSNNHFSGGDSDGIQMGGYGTTIGPGNIFTNIVYSTGRHVDSIQLYGEVDHQTITGNFFSGNSDCIMAPDGGNAVTITNNVFYWLPTSYWVVFLGSQTNLTFTHNTVISGYGVVIGSKAGTPTNKNMIFRDNIFVGSGIIDSGDQRGCETGCIFDHNLFADKGISRGSNNLIGTPTFVGGAAPNSFAGYQLTSGSLGYQSASDGKNMGINGFAPILVAPTRLRVL